MSATYVPAGAGDTNASFARKSIRVTTNGSPVTHKLDINDDLVTCAGPDATTVVLPDHPAVDERHSVSADGSTLVTIQGGAFPLVPSDPVLLAGPGTVDVLFTTEKHWQLVCCPDTSAVPFGNLTEDRTIADSAGPESLLDLSLDSKLPVLTITASATLAASDSEAGGHGQLALYFDGVLVTDSRGAGFDMTDNFQTVTVQAQATGVAPGAHTVSLMWTSTDGGLVCNAGSDPLDYHACIAVEESAS